MSRFLFGNGQSIEKKATIWNAVASFAYSLQSAVLLMVITRTTGLVDGGIFTIAYTVTQMMATIGSFGMRDFQVSDSKSEYSYRDYFSSRIVSVIIMIIVCIGYSLFQGYNGEKLILIVLLCAYRVVDGVEDVVHGEIQKSNRLDVAAKVMSLRIILSSVTFCISFIVSRNLFISCAVMLISSVVLALCLNIVASKSFSEIVVDFRINNVVKLLWTCLPLCIGGFLYNYLVNAPKYSIDRVLTEEMQSIFSILFMPIFAVNMFSMFVFKPMVAHMGVLWNNGDVKGFRQIVRKQSLIILGISGILMICGAVAGPEVLGFIYKVDLQQYRWLFVLLIFFGGLAAYTAFYVAVITIMRFQRVIVISYFIGMVFEICTVDFVVSKLSLWGAGIMYGAGIGIVLAILLVAYLIKARGKGLSELG